MTEKETAFYKWDIPNSIISDSMPLIGASYNNKMSSWKIIFYHCPPKYQKTDSKLKTIHPFYLGINLLYMMNKKFGKQVETYLTFLKLRIDKVSMPKLSGNSAFII